MKLGVYLPSDAEVMVETGQHVDFKTPLCRTKQRKTETVPIADQLDIEPKKIFVHMKKAVGDEVREGDVLAAKKGMLSTREYVAHVNGTITLIDHHTGMVHISTKTDDDELRYCYFTGEIVSIEGDYIEIKVKDAHRIGVEQMPNNVGGRIAKIGSNGIFTEEEVSGAFAMGKDINEMDVSKLEALGCKGFLILEGETVQTQLPVIDIKREEDYKDIGEKSYNYFLSSTERDSIYVYTHGSEE